MSDHELPAMPAWTNPYAGRNIHEVQAEARLRYPQGSSVVFTDISVIDPDNSDMVLASGGVNGDPICTPDKGIYIPVFVFEAGKVAKTVYVAEPNVVSVSLPNNRMQDHH